MPRIPDVETSVSTSRSLMINLLYVEIEKKSIVNEL